MNRGVRIGGLVGLIAGLTLAGCDRPSDRVDDPPAPTTAAVDGARIIAADAEPGSWLTHGRTYSEQRFSPLDQINQDTAGDLGLAWSFDLDTDRGIEATPIVVDGVLYTTSSWSMVYALDARTGELKWWYDPEVPRAWGAKACCDVVNRGVAVWQGRVFVGTLDGRLVALDAETGEPIWDVNTIDRTQPYTITGAPRVVKGRVLIGNGGGELGVRGYVSAYDVDSGELVWRFHTVPGNPADGFERPILERAAETWTGEWWRYGGGGTVWDSMAYDPELDLLYIGVGNGSPWNQAIRSPDGGDNLFLSSIVALRPDTGDYVWHYQSTPGETWDYTATQHMILADLEIDGRVRKVLMQAPKNGFFYVVDRQTGELISAEAYVPVNWATHVDLATGRPVEVPAARAFNEEPFVQSPSPFGGHNWQPMSFNPATGLVYIPAMDIPYLFAADEGFTHHPGFWNTGVSQLLASVPDDPGLRKSLKALVRGHLLAWDPVAQKEAWRVQYDGPWNGGTLTTAGGLVFQGTADARFVAYRADTGELLWSSPTQTGVIAAPITYSVDGEQYVTVMAGWGGAFATTSGVFTDPRSLPNVSRVLTYKLGGTQTLPPLNWEPPSLPEPVTPTAPTQVVDHGKAVYHRFCYACHGDAAVGGSLPDLRYSPTLHGPEWREIVLEGTRSDNGMISFAEVLSADDSEAVRAYIIAQAWRAYEQESGGE